MRILTLVCLFLLQQYATTPSTAPAANKGSSTQTPTYTADGRLMFPANYREWIFLSSGVDMSYLPNAMQMKHSMFDNVFVNPDAYRAFQESGTWPDKTMLVLEVRMAGTNASINKSRAFSNHRNHGL